MDEIILHFTFLIYRNIWQYELPDYPLPYPWIILWWHQDHLSLFRITAVCSRQKYKSSIEIACRINIWNIHTVQLFINFVSEIKIECTYSSTKKLLIWIKTPVNLSLEDSSAICSPCILNPNPNHIFFIKDKTTLNPNLQLHPRKDVPNSYPEHFQPFHFPKITYPNWSIPPHIWWYDSKQ